MKPTRATTAIEVLKRERQRALDYEAVSESSLNDLLKEADGIREQIRKVQEVIAAVDEAIVVFEQVTS